MSKELDWKRSKAGYFSASELSRLMSKSDGWTDANIAYLYEKQYERENELLVYTPENRNFRKGKENEPYAVAWMREHKADMGEIFHCDVDFDDKLFVRTDFGYGFSPDIIIVPPGKPVTILVPMVGENFAGEYLRKLWESRTFEVVEVKSMVGNEERSRLTSKTYPYDKKRMRVWLEHKWQIVGQFVGFPELETVHLLKYDSMDEDNDTDDRSVLDERRGILFTFKRSEAGKAIDYAIERLKFAHEFLEAGEDPDNINEFWKKRKKLFI